MANLSHLHLEGLVMAFMAFSLGVGPGHWFNSRGLQSPIFCLLLINNRGQERGAALSSDYFLLNGNLKVWHKLDLHCQYKIKRVRPLAH